MTAPCPEHESLHSALIDEALAPDERARLTGHLRDCAGCRQHVDSLRRTRDLLANFPVRRLPSDVLAHTPRPADAGADVNAPSPSPSPSPSRSRARALAARAAASLAIATGLVLGAAYTLGGEPADTAPVVRVPVDVFVADHLVHTVGGPLPAPVFVEAGR